MNHQEIARLKFLNAQNVYRTIRENDFNNLSIEKQKELREIIENGDIARLKYFLKRITETELCMKPVMELRQIARALCIKDYNQLTKSMLLSEIIRNGTFSRNGSRIRT